MDNKEKPYLLAISIKKNNEGLIKKKNDPLALFTIVHNVKDFPFYKRNMAKEGINFAIDLGDKKAPSHNGHYYFDNHPDYVVHIDRSNTYSIFIVTNRIYNNRVATQLIQNIKNKLENNDDFDDHKNDQKNDDESHKLIMTQKDIEATLNKFLKEYEDPVEVDKIIKIQKTIDETKAIMMENINTLIERGQSIDDMVAKSEILSESSKIFYDGTRKLNRRCPCTIL